MTIPPQFPSAISSLAIADSAAAASAQNTVGVGPNGSPQTLATVAASSVAAVVPISSPLSSLLVFVPTSTPLALSVAATPALPTTSTVAIVGTTVPVVASIQTPSTSPLTSATTITAVAPSIITPATTSTPVVLSLAGNTSPSTTTVAATTDSGSQTTAAADSEIAPPVGTGGGIVIPTAADESAAATSTTGIGGVFAETLASSSIVPTDSPTISPQTTGTVNTVLPSGGITVAPFPTAGITAATTTIQPANVTGSATSVAPAVLPTGQNIFAVVGTDAPPAQIPSRGGHPVARLGISQSVTMPIETNKFYASLFLANQTDSVWTHPYSVRWSRGGDDVNSMGMAISHIEASQFVFGDGAPASYYASPIGIDSLIFSAKELTGSSVLTSDTFGAFSVNANLAVSSGSAPLMTMPLVQGMGLITAIYNSATPLIQTGVFYKSLSPLSITNGIYKTTVTLLDGHRWVIYIIPNEGESNPQFILESSTTIQISGPFSGVVQVAKIPGNTTNTTIYDGVAGVYATSGTVSATVSTGSTASYSLSWSKAGNTARKLMMFALPHHVQSFDSTTATAVQQKIQLQTSTKGIATAVLTDSFTMVEQLATK